MSVEAKLQAVLATCCTHVYPDVAPGAQGFPYVVYQQVGGRVINFIENSIPDKQNAEFQITVWAQSRTAASAISDAIEDAMRAAQTFTAEPIAARRAQHEPATRAYGSSQDFSVWSERE